MPFTSDISGDCHAVGQPYTGDRTPGRVGLFRRRGVNAGTDAARLGTTVQRLHLTLILFVRPRVAHQLIHCCHEYSTPAQNKQKRSACGALSHAVAPTSVERLSMYDLRCQAATASRPIKAA